MTYPIVSLTLTSMTGTPAGWQPAHDRPGQLRYWDGDRWTDHYAPMVTPPIPTVVPAPTTAPRRAMNRVVLEVLGGLLLLIVGVVIGGAASTGSNDSPKASPSSAPQVSTTQGPSPSDKPIPTDDPTPTDDPPTPALTKTDFTLRVKITDKQCFGSAGCNLEYEIVPTYTSGLLSDLDGLNFDVTYRVIGDESGPQIGTLTFTGSKYTSTSETASTQSTNIMLKATVTELDTY